MFANPDLVIATTTETDSSAVWVLEPQGRSTFRIVVRCRPQSKTRANKETAPGLLSALGRRITHAWNVRGATRQHDVRLKEAL